MGGRGGSGTAAAKQPAAKQPAAKAPAAPAASQSLEQQIFAAIRNGAGLHIKGELGEELRQDNLVMLDTIRSQLKGFSFDEVSAELKRLDRERRIQLVTHPAHYNMTESQKAATFRMGGKDMHAVYRV